jgi:hypothetical protein
VDRVRIAALDKEIKAIAPAVISWLNQRQSADEPLPDTYWEFQWLVDCPHGMATWMSSAQTIPAEVERMYGQLHLVLAKTIEMMRLNMPICTVDVKAADAVEQMRTFAQTKAGGPARRHALKIVQLLESQRNALAIRKVANA